MANKGTCKAPGCEKEVQAKGYCPRHYGQWRKGKLPKPRYTTCHAEGCRKPRARRGLCLDHFSKQYEKAKPVPAEAPAAPAAEA